MFNAIAHALLALAPEFDAARVEDVPMKPEGPGSMVRRATSGGRRWAPSAWRVTSLQISYMAPRGGECAKLAVEKSL